MKDVLKLKKKKQQKKPKNTVKKTTEAMPYIHCYVALIIMIKQNELYEIFVDEDGKEHIKSVLESVESILNGG